MFLNPKTNTVFKDINGLVHFIHINRSSGRIVVPIIDMDNKYASLIKKQVKWLFLFAKKKKKQKKSFNWICKLFLGVEYGEYVAFVCAKGPYVVDMAGRCVFLFVFSVVRGQSWHTVETKGNAKSSSGECHQTACGARRCGRRILSVSKEMAPFKLPCDSELMFDILICRWLVETCFPKSNGKIQCFELYSMYVGLTSAHTLLDYNRRLVAILRDNLADLNGFEC